MKTKRNMATILLSVVLTASSIAGSYADQVEYRAPAVVAAISSNRIDALLAANRANRDLVVAYVAGFTIFTDHICGGVLRPSNRFALNRLIGTMRELSETSSKAATLLASTATGANDAALYIGENGCMSPEGVAVRANLSRYMDGR